MNDKLLIIIPDRAKDKLIDALLAIENMRNKFREI